MMAYFANFTGKLSHGIYKMPSNHFNLAWSADKVGAMRNQVNKTPNQVDVHNMASIASPVTSQGVTLMAVMTRADSADDAGLWILLGHGDGHSARRHGPPGRPHSSVNDFNGDGKRIWPSGVRWEPPSC